MNKVGIGFSGALKAAGLGQVAVVWSGDGDLSFGGAVTESDRQAVLAVREGYVGPSDVDLVKIAAVAVIDHEAGVTRSRYITIAPGQEATYWLKATQAAAFSAGGYQGAVPPMVQAEVDATGVAAPAAADTILARQALWEAVAARVESARRRGKVAVGNAAEASGVRAVLAAVVAELQAL